MADQQPASGATMRPKAALRKKRARDVCFVLMPFGGWGDEYYEAIYCPAVEAAGLEPHRADDLFRPSTIVNDIWAYSKKARLLLADLTGKNPNVFYELGLAHALAKPVILVAASMEDIPFDLRALRVITYDNHDPEWGSILRRKVESSIKEVLKAPKEAVLPAFLKVEAQEASRKITPQEKKILEIKQELDLLKQEVRSGATQPETRRHIGPEQAYARIQEFMETGMPPELIVEQVSKMGAPRGWILQRMKELSRKRMKELPRKRHKRKAKRVSRRAN